MFKEQVRIIINSNMNLILVVNAGIFYKNSCSVSSADLRLSGLRLLSLEPNSYRLIAMTMRLVFVPPRLLFTPQQFAVLVKSCWFSITPRTVNGNPCTAATT